MGLLLISSRDSIASQSEHARNSTGEISPSLTKITPVHRAGFFGERLRKTPCGFAVRRPLLRPLVRNRLDAQSQRHPVTLCTYNSSISFCFCIAAGLASSLLPIFAKWLSKRRGSYADLLRCLCPQVSDTCCHQGEERGWCGKGERQGDCRTVVSWEKGLKS